MQRLTFSQRIGKAPIPTDVQVDTMSDPLRNGLWSVLHSTIFRHTPEYVAERTRYDEFNFYAFFVRIFDGLFKVPTDLVGPDGRALVRTVREQFFTVVPMMAYDMIDFIVELAHERGTPGGCSDQELASFVNGVLEREVCGYRVIAGRLAPITSEIELGEIAEAIARGNRDPFNGAREHVKTALGLFSDRDAPDYRNSVKESISAVESVLKVLTKNSKIDLAPALAELEKKGITLHGGLKAGIKAIYGYTSDEGGIRHAMIDDPQCDAEDARYMLVICSALVNFLIAKGGKAGLP